MKRGLADDLVVAPYASALALIVAPEESCLNLQRLAADGLAGRFGLYEAIDYTPARLPRGQQSAVVRSFMAHHQGMILLSLAHVLLERPMQRRFESDPLFKATLLAAAGARSEGRRALFASRRAVRDTQRFPAAPKRRCASSSIPTRRYRKCSSCRTAATTSWSPTRAAAAPAGRISPSPAGAKTAPATTGARFCYIRDTASGDFWSTAHQPTRSAPARYEAIFTEARAEFRRRDNDFESHTEIVVSPEDDIELRRLRITNRSRTRRTIDVTSYAEVALAPPAADALHPAFSNLFVQTEIVRERQAILCTRRPALARRAARPGCST